MNLLDKIAELLMQQQRYVSEDGTLLKAKVYEDIQMMNKDLLSLLLSDQQVKEHFFVNIDGTLVFDKQKFAWLIDSKEFLPDSYTMYSNKIGLTVDNEFISNKNQVVLDFPYKDCVLEGGQTKEDQDRKEIVYNEVLAQDEIRRMLEPKVFTNAKRYSVDGVEAIDEFRDDDNLIIKGNNLIALSSLLKRYEGKIQLIYIDPPFNTGKDSFKYNDKFKRSTWLTFMKSRLKLAKRLLREDGNIFVHIDNNQQHYVKILMDEIFDEKNFVQDIIWAYGSASGGRSGGAKPVNVHDYILNYAKKYPSRKAIKQYTPYSEKYVREWFKYEDEDGRIYQRRQRGKDEDGKPIWSIQYLDESLGVPLTTVWTDIKQVYANPQAYKAKNKSTSEIELDFGNSGQKPEKLLQRIIEMSTNEHDIVLDFFMGSGTTLATSLKLNRRFIGVEQMESQVKIAQNRLVDAIKGKQSGISKGVDWQGGGSFVYCELKEDAQGLIDEVEQADEHEIFDLKEKIYHDKRIVPYIQSSELEDVDDDFEGLSLRDKKKALIKLIDKNKLYIDYSEMNDVEYSVSERDKQFTNSFYGVN